MPDLPQAAIDAGVKALLEQHGIQQRIPPGDESAVWPIVWIAVGAAAPHLAAAERERIAVLADKHIAWIPGKSLGNGRAEPGRWFSAIIREEAHRGT